MALTREQFEQKGKLLAWAPALGAVGLWGLYGARVFLGWDWLRHADDREATPAMVYLGMAAVGSVIVAIWIYWKLKVTERLLKHGKMAEGKIVAVSLLRRAGKQPVTFSYVVEGKEITLKRDLDVGYKVGDVVGVLYDPESPGRCEVLAGE